ncbi:MAG: DNA polymerase III subunit gamma/tau, partial [Bilophila sp.]
PDPAPSPDTSIQDRGGWAGGSEAHDTVADSAPAVPVPIVQEQAVPAPAPSPLPAPAPESDATAPSWAGFLQYCDEQVLPGTALPLHAVQQAVGTLTERTLTLATTTTFQYEQLVVQARLEALRQLVCAYTGREVSVAVLPPARPRKTEADLKQELATHPVIRSLTETFDAALLRCIPVETVRDSGTLSKQGESNAQHE